MSSVNAKLDGMKKLFGQIAALFGGEPETKAAHSQSARLPASGRLDRTAEDLYPTQYVYVEDDGTARELEADEIEYLNTKFHGADGNRPYIKTSYEQLTPDNRIGGYLRRGKLPAGAHVKSAAEAIPAETAEKAIGIVKSELPISFCVKSGARLERIIDPRSGRKEFGLPGVEVSSGTFSATITAGVWRVVRAPDASAIDTEQACYADVSAASGRIITYGWL